MKCECGTYAYALTTLPHGTAIYHCSGFGKMWGEKLVHYEVSFVLHESGGNGWNPNNVAIAKVEETALSAVTSSVPAS